VHCKPYIFHHLRIKRHGDDQTLMQTDASANVISRPCVLVQSYHNPANLRVKTFQFIPPDFLRSEAGRANAVAVCHARPTREKKRQRGDAADRVAAPRGGQERVMPRLIVTRTATAGSFSFPDSLRRSWCHDGRAVRFAINPCYFLNCDGWYSSCICHKLQVNSPCGFAAILRQNLHRKLIRNDDGCPSFP
jgi:hypothetical protein